MTYCLHYKRSGQHFYAIAILYDKIIIVLFGVCCEAFKILPKSLKATLPLTVRERYKVIHLHPKFISNYSVLSPTSSAEYLIL